MNDPASHRLWHRRVLALALPIIAANLTQPLLSIVDTGISGHLAAPASLGGVALGGLFFNTVYWAFGFLRMATTGLVAQAHGAGDGAGLRATLVRALILALAIGLVLVAVKGPLIAAALALLGGSPEVTGAARNYCAVRLWAAPMALANYVVLGTMLGRQRAATALLVQASINLVNMVAAIGFVYGLGWGVTGLGGATALADTLGFALGAAILWRIRPRGLPPLDLAAIVERAAVARLVLVNRDIFLRTLCLLVCFAWFAHEGALQGDTILAANAVLLNLQTFMAFVLDGFAQAAEALVGAAIGAHARTDYARAIRVSTLWAGISAAVIALVYAVIGPAIIAGLTDHADVRVAAMTYLPWAAASPIVSVWSFQLDGIYIGATRTRDLRNTMAVAMTCFLVAAWTLQPAYGNHGLWAALMVLMAARAAGLGLLLPRLGRAAFAA
jgi:MATE family multidrug resistance protein